MDSGAARIEPTRSAWCVTEWEMSAGGTAWRAAAVGMPGSLLVWVGATGARASLRQAALGVGGAASGGARAEALARRLSTALSRPVWLLEGAGELDRLHAPLLERALLRALRDTPGLLLEPAPAPSLLN